MFLVFQSQNDTTWQQPLYPKKNATLLFKFKCFSKLVTNQQYCFQQKLILAHHMEDEICIYYRKWQLLASIQLAISYSKMCFHTFSSSISAIKITLLALSNFCMLTLKMRHVLLFQHLLEGAGAPPHCDPHQKHTGPEKIRKQTPDALNSFLGTLVLTKLIWYKLNNRSQQTRISRTFGNKKEEMNKAYTWTLPIFTRWNQLASPPCGYN